LGEKEGIQDKSEETCFYPPPGRREKGWNLTTPPGLTELKAKHALSFKGREIKKRMGVLPKKGRSHFFEYKVRKSRGPSER